MVVQNTVVYAREPRVTLEEYTDLLNATSLAERRPMDDPARLESGLAHANLFITARKNGRLIGSARSVTDFSLCCYIADLLVDEREQGQGIGQKLIQETCRYVHADAKVLLISAPKAITFYEHIGFERLPHAFEVPTS